MFRVIRSGGALPPAVQSITDSSRKIKTEAAQRLHIRCTALSVFRQLKGWLFAAFTVFHVSVVFECPCHKSGDVRHKAAAKAGEGIFRARRNFGIKPAGNQAGIFEIAQRVGQYLRRDVGDGLSDSIEACGFVLGEDTQNKHGPFAGKAGNHISDGA